MRGCRHSSAPRKDTSYEHFSNWQCSRFRAPGPLAPSSSGTRRGCCGGRRRLRRRQRREQGRGGRRSRLRLCTRAPLRSSSRRATAGGERGGCSILRGRAPRAPTLRPSTRVSRSAACSHLVRVIRVRESSRSVPRVNDASAGNESYGPIHGRRGFREHIDPTKFPADSMDPDEAYELLHTGLMLDGRETLNLASFVTTWMEPQAEALIHDTLRKNHIDHEEYPAASLIEESCVHMLGDLFNAPDPAKVVGVGTIGSSEAIMLGLLAHKRSWRHRQEAAGRADGPPECGVRRRDARGLGQVRELLRRRDAQDPHAARPLRAERGRRRAAGGREHDRRRRGARDHPRGRGRSDLGDQRRARADQGREGLGHPAARRRRERRVHRPVRGAGDALGLPPGTGRVDQRFGTQVRTRLPGRRMADLQGRVEAARGPRVQRELPRRGAADLHVQLLPGLGDDPGADVQLRAARSQRVQRDRREHARQRPPPQREPRGVGAVRDPQPRSGRAGRHVQAEG